MSEKIADWLIGQKAISSDERELYAYAVHCLFSLIYPIAFASVVGIISGMIMESIVMIIPFMIIILLQVLEVQLLELRWIL